MLRPRSIFGLTVAATVFAGCSAAAPRQPLQAPDRFSVVYREDAAREPRLVPLPSDRVWELLPAAFGDLGFPSAPASNEPGRVMMTPHLRVQGELYAGELTSDYLDCGTSVAGGVHADAYEVTFAIIATVHEAGEEATRLDILIDGEATHPIRRGGASRCTSTGAFEDLLVSFLTRRANGG